MTTPEISQEMIRAYDEYTHLTLDRRGFIDKLTRLAGSAAAAAAIVPLIAANSAKAAIVPPDDKRISSEDVTFKAGGGSISAYLALPAGSPGKLPAVVVVHENRGLNPHIEDVVRRIALEGFIGLGPDFLSLLGGTPTDEEKARDAFGKLKPADAVAIAVGAADHLRKDPRANGKVGVVGFCWGGGIANQLAVHDPRLNAAVAYYGAQPVDADVPRIKAKLMLHYAGLDDRTNAGIPAYEKALKAAGVQFQVFVYEGANHAFNNDTAAARYDKPAADLAWSRTVAFLKESLA